ncbi:EpsG family protein [Pseudoalteromonas sp. T1lg76]|uniref:EpsG family protein n=1 Tax=Pseudoalteromonas sp. T1lg76 TaxID=2077103 RepID=UPI001319DF9A|nr:EpsG family protein [Pseudoalteromonas sp. T1lg76]
MFLILAFSLLVFSAFRLGGVGKGDYDAYLRLYGNIQNWEQVVDPTVHVEFGFRFLSYLGNAIGFDGQFIIAVMALLSGGIVLYVIYKYSPYKMLSLLVWFPYFLSMNMHTARTSVAAAFGLLFFIAFIHKKYYKSILYFLLAFSFHTSALVLLVIFLTRFQLKTLLLMLSFSALFFVFFSPFSMVIQAFSLIGFEKVAAFISIYLNSSDYGYPMPLYDPRILLGFLVVFLIYRARRWLSNYFNEDYFKVYILGMFLMISLSDVTVLAWRISYYFLLLGVIVIPWLAKIYNDADYQKTSIKRMATTLFILVYSLYSMPIILAAEPYEFYLK